MCPPLIIISFLWGVYMNPLVHKVDLFMKLHILPKFEPDKIHWVFSISGGKDSYVLCESIRNWYNAHSLPLKASGIYIWQWGEENPQEFLQNTFPWLQNLQVIDTRTCTASLLKNGKNQQAPCRSCSDIRHHFSDIYLEQLNTNCPILLCRGLHMTDMIISILWRLIWFGPGNRLEGKGKPLVHLTKNAYLAKPLCFVREYESQMYAFQNNYTPLRCDCPAHLYPSRRDIIEESIRQFYTSPLWEFDVPGSDQYLHDTAGLSDISYLKSISLCGQEAKENTIPDGYFEFAKKHFLQSNIPDTLFASAPLLENYAADFLSFGAYSNHPEYKFSCKLLSDPNSISSFDLKMIGTLGPFWASFVLPPHQRELFNLTQKQIWGFVPDVNWSQVYSLMNLYYENQL